MVRLGDQQPGNEDGEGTGGRTPRDAPAMEKPLPAGQTAPVSSPAENVPILSERKRCLRSLINDLVNKLAHHSGISHEDLHREWKQQMKGKGNGEATEADLQRKLDWIKNKIIAFNSAAKTKGGRNCRKFGATF